MEDRLIKRLGTVFALTWVGSVSVQAQTVDLAYSDVSTYTESGITANLPGGGTLQSDELIGVYSFVAANQNPASPSGWPAGAYPTTPFWSTCLSPGGLLDSGSYNYTLETYAAANGGLNPSAQWAGYVSGVTPGYGIQNAQYLWRLYGAGVMSGAYGNKNDAGAGLALAMYAALYNSTAYAAAPSSGSFKVTTASSGATADMTSFLNGLAAAGAATVQANSALGYVFEGTNPNNDGTGGPTGQELIINYSPVPEPTTMVAGALLLLPFGASTVRFFRKNRGA